MAKEDLSMALHLFKEVNNREPMITELPMIRQVQAGVILQAGTADFIEAWDAFHNPPVAESDVDWDAMGKDLSKWGLI